MHEAANRLLYFFMMAKGTKVHDLTAMVRLYLETLIRPPVRNAAEDGVVELGPGRPRAEAVAQVYGAIGEASNTADQSIFPAGVHGGTLRNQLAPGRAPGVAG